MKRVLVVGAGGLGCSAMTVLAQAGGVAMTIVDDDAVAKSNLQRQTLYDDGDVGRPKTETSASKLAKMGAQADVRHCRFLPHNALRLIEGHDLIVEGADNMPTKFLASDAAAIARVPIVQAGAVRWTGWTLCRDEGSACLRCLFEDIPEDRVETCAEAGVVGPVVGVVGALQASLVLRVLAGEACAGELWHYEALSGALRRRTLHRREDCIACSGGISDLAPERYLAACAA